MIEFLTLLFSYSGMMGSVYGFGEKMCGDVGKAVACDKNATTATGDAFDPDKATVAIALPSFMLVRRTTIQIRIDDGPCKFVQINDKKPFKWKNSTPWDLTPATVELLTGKPAKKHWSGIVHICWDTIVIGKK